MKRFGPGFALALIGLLAGCASQGGPAALPGYTTQVVNAHHFRLEYQARGASEAVESDALLEAARQVGAAGYDWFAADSQTLSRGRHTSVLLDVYPGRGVRPDGAHIHPAQPSPRP